MYQPISFNVIRQALKVMGLPTPTMRVLSNYKLPDGTETAEYLLTWTLAQVERYYGRLDTGLVPGDKSSFVYDVGQSFAEDVQVTPAETAELPGMFSIVAHVRVAPRPEQLRMLLD